ncbi:MAG: (E)-4-hydroxy-3-methylbut-2-enyl-diphosphate synthase [Parachlamydiales bacterium]|jgi:(E)-4-hydroxy-3-methylbut-2-enyl-diphosphate synthase
MENSKKFFTRKVCIGNVEIGQNNPIRIQSMTNTKTEDIEATINQIMVLQDAGCEIVRVTAQGKKQAYALEIIKNNLIKKNYLIPIVADIHFYPPAAYIAADFVEKIRINPGNFYEKKASSKAEISDYDYEKELKEIEENLFPLIEKLKKNKKALRIGVNHGSLSDRIMKKYGNTVNAMIQSAVEYANICRKYDFHNLVFSMKTSSAFLTIQSNKALVEEMRKLKWDYPIHLGVTEAGDEEDGIIKSSIGIGSLLLEGIGDTIRFSLTEDPVKEIKPALKLVELCSKNKISFIEKSKDPFFDKIKLAAVNDEIISDKQFSMADIFYLKNRADIKEFERTKKPIIIKNNNVIGENIFSLSNITDNDLENKNHYAIEISSNDDFEKLKKLSPSYIIYKPQENRIEELQKFNLFLNESNIKIPVIALLQYDQDFEQNRILASSEIGLIIFEKMANAILLETKNDSLNLALNIFQACDLKKFKPDYISCPGCGRTLFDIQTAVKKIKEKTSHLQNIKIAIMGCIVNGLGEMQDADFGYVGSKPNKIDLYVKNQCIEKNIDEKEAVEKLISLIKLNNMWQEEKQ